MHLIQSYFTVNVITVLFRLLAMLASLVVIKLRLLHHISSNYR